MTSLEKYLKDSRNPVYSILFVIPLFLFYEILALVLHTFHITIFRNGADVMLRSISSLAGMDQFPILVFFILIILTVFAGIYKKEKNITINMAYFPIMLLESILYAVIMGSVGVFLTDIVLIMHSYVSLTISPPTTNFWVNTMLALGAGFYEGLLFRLILIELLLIISKSVYSKPSKAVIFNANAIFALVVASLIFSYNHYIGVYGDAFEVSSFTFRIVSGVYLSVIYLGRGFGVSAWSHALYDLFLLNGLMR
ncbi:MAG: CPBP family intramembrane metalloprotease [Candidatus Cloacimonetes bacterium]|nr:CPBP family intramembrane metalloprotease [Candidatus Cloacimonadota bacterium]